MYIIIIIISVDHLGLTTISICAATVLIIIIIKDLFSLSFDWSTVNAMQKSCGCTVKSDNF